MANLWELHEELAEGGPSKANSNDSLFGEEIIDDKNYPPLFMWNETWQNRLHLSPSNPFPLRNSDSYYPLTCLSTLLGQS